MTVAVKKLFSQSHDADIIADFSQEVSIMTKLRHPNVLLVRAPRFRHLSTRSLTVLTQFMGACTTPGNLMIVTEYMPRGSVYDVLHDETLGPRLTFDAKVDIMRQTAQGVNWLHLSKPPFIHRDLCVFILSFVSYTHALRTEKRAIY